MSHSEEHSDNLLLRAQALKEGYNKVVGRGEKGLKHLEFGRLFVSSGDWSGETDGCEAVLDIFKGSATLELECPSGGGTRFERLGGRSSAFDGLGTAIYLPPRTSYRLSASGGAVEAAIFTAPAESAEGQAVVVGPEDAVVATVGKDNWTREVVTMVGDNVPAAKLLVGETINPPGNWSSSPPHKHDTFNPPNEAVLEEIYFFQVDPRQGFGIIRVYSDPKDPAPLNEIYVVEDGDTVVIPRGYHPVAAAPGYTLHYTWALAGEVRRLGAWSDDPRHAWLKNA